MGLDECPDGGKCHHQCGLKCWRVQNCGALSGVYLNDEWPDSVKEKHGVRRVNPRHASPVKAISDALTRVGVSKRKDQAEVIGESPTMWSRYLNGHRSPQCAKVAEWMRSARSEGYELRLQWDADGAR